MHKARAPSWAPSCGRPFCGWNTGRARALWWAHEGRWRWAPRRTLGGATSEWEEEGGGNAIRRVGTRGRRRQGRAGVPACRRAKSAARDATEPSGECVVCGVSYACPDACIRDARVRRCASPDSASMRGPAPLVRAARLRVQHARRTSHALQHTPPISRTAPKSTKVRPARAVTRCWRTWFVLSSISKSIFISFPIISLVFSTCQTQSCLLNIVDVPRALRECRLDE